MKKKSLTIIIIFATFLLISCNYKNTGKLLETDNLLTDNHYYFNEKLDLRIGAKFNGWNHKTDKFEEDSFYPKDLKLLKINGHKFRGTLHFMRQFDRFALITERYKGKIDSSILAILRKREFTNIKFHKLENNHISYEKSTNTFHYLIEEKSIKKNGNHLRYIIYFRVPIDSASQETSSSFINFEKIQRLDMLDFAIKYDKEHDNPNIDLGLNSIHLNDSLKNHINKYFQQDSKLQLYTNINARNVRNADKLKINSSSINELLEEAKFYEFEDKFKSIVGMNDIIVFNEAHNWPFCRFQLMKNLPLLNSFGYHNLFVEALNDKTVLKDEDFISNSLGFYTNEPTFGNLLKKALKENYTVYGYEYNPNQLSQNEVESRSQRRERSQAQNISNILTTNQINKAIVLCGFDHGKKNVVNGIEPMVSILDKMENKSIVSIDQTLFIGNEKIILKELQLKHRKPYLISSPKIKSLGFDFVLIEYNESHISNMPEYIFRIGENETQLNKINCYINKNDLIILFSDKHKKNNKEIPLLVYQQDRDSIPEIFLDKGRYLIRIFDQKNQLKCENSFMVH